MTANTEHALNRPAPSSYKLRVRDHYDALAGERDAWRTKNSHYHSALARYLKFLVPEGKRVLELGCATGELLASLKPSRGVGLDLSPKMAAAARAKHPDLEFHVADAEDSSAWDFQGTFDFVILSDLIGLLEDVQAALEGLHAVITPDTRIIIANPNPLWEPVLRAGERLGLKMPTPVQNWLAPSDIENLLTLARFEPVKRDRQLLFPKRIPLLGPAFAFLGGLPLLNRLCLTNWVVARPAPETVVPAEKSVSVVIPCRNERGNIEAAVQRTPDMGPHTEIIFIDGHSTDGTQEEIKRVIQAYPDKDISFMVQDRTGKGDAVRKAFAHAKCDILMILDADLTVPPEDLPKFHRAISSNQGEFINGSRLVYPMEEEAMRFLNMLGNRFFSLVFTWLLNQRIKDTLCGTKVISREHYNELSANRAYFGDFDPFGDFDLLFGASKLNLKLLEVPVRYRARTYGETQISRFRHGWLLLKMSVFAAKKLKFAPGKGS